MPSPTCELIYAGLLYICLKRFTQNTGINIEQVYRRDERMVVPSHEFDYQWVNQLVNEFEKFQQVTQVKSLVRVGIDADLREICHIACMSIESACAQFIIAVNENRGLAASIGSGCTMSFDLMYKAPLSELIKAYQFANTALTILEERYENIQDIKWNTN